MKANEEKLLKFLDGTKQFILPIFQRRYSWKKEQCKQLWDDIVRVGENEDVPSHFLGSIVSIGDGSPTVPKFLVIDGQQRLTTVALLISVLGRVVEVADVDIGIDRSRLDGYYLFNDREDGELRHKQLLTPNDKWTLIQLLEDGQASDNSSLLVETYQFFEDKLKRGNLESVYKGIQKLMIVDIALDPRADNPQLIFESLNSTGLSLSQADLIRNYVLMGQEYNIQKSLYENLWYPMEQRFGTAYAKRFDLFIRDYLTLNTRTIPNKGRVYEHFKRYIGEKRHSEALKAIIAEIVRHSEYYVRIALLNEPDPELSMCIEAINSLNVEVTFPFLLGVYEDYEQGKIEKADVIEIFRLTESYVFRRAICDIPTNMLNKTFAGLMGQIDKDNYLQSLKVAFSRMSGTQRFPSNDEFQLAFQTKDVYNLRTRNYLLLKLENYERKELVKDGEYTIEHVMPQSLSDEWQAELGENWAEVHEKYLHTIGNLTLTAYNPELSNSIFKDKQEIRGGFGDSPLYLNRSLAQADRWNEVAIVKRAVMHSEKALNIWRHHGVFKGIDSPQKTGWTLNDFPYLTGELLNLFEQLKQQILRLDVSISEQINKHYIVYKSNKIFVSITPQAKRLRLTLNLPFAEIIDPQKRCRNVANIGKLGIGDVDVGISSENEINYIMFLIRQAYEKQKHVRP